MAPGGPVQHPPSLTFWRLSATFSSLHCLVSLQTSGLSTWIGQQMLSLSSLPPWAVTLLACILVSIVTEFVSNPATITIFLPIVCSLVSRAGL